MSPRSPDLTNTDFIFGFFKDEELNKGKVI